MTFRLHSLPLALFALCAQTVPPGASAQSEAGAAVALPYADRADLVLASPVIVDASIRSAARIRGEEAAGVAPGMVRYYVEADVLALLRSPGSLPQRIGYLLDVAPDASGRLPKLRKMHVLVFARQVSGSAGQLQLVSPAGQQAWSPALDASVRAIAAEAVSRDAPPQVTGVGNAFHVAGSLPGEGETQIFLQTADNRPVSLSVLRRPGEQPRWAVALSEIVDDAAAPPRRETLLWYRLACALPRELPSRSTAQMEGNDADIAREDYRFVLARLGACERTLPPIG
jgi:hypothetical protein